MSPSIPPRNIQTTMRAWVSKAREPPSKVLTLSSIPTPPTTLAPTFVLVKISHAALSPGEITIMKALPRFARGSPSIIALELTGTIVAVGASVRPGLHPGVAVFGIVPKKLILAGVGSLAEYVSLPADCVVVKPENVSWEEAAGLAGCGVTAVEYLNWSGYRSGDRVLVNGATGGIGVMVVQIARNAVGSEGKVIATCSAESADMVKGLGADETLDYRSIGPLYQYLETTYSDQPFDGIIDNVGCQDLYNHSPKYLKEGQRYMCIGVKFGKNGLGDAIRVAWRMAQNLLWPRILGGTPRKFCLQPTNGSAATLEQLRRLVEEGKVRGMVDSVWEMEDVVE
ncbi:MAG: hypothetical protein Q9187_005657, partial [Circinaria calcarea]